MLGQTIGLYAVGPRFLGAYADHPRGPWHDLGQLPDLFKVLDCFVCPHGPSNGGAAGPTGPVDPNATAADLTYFVSVQCAAADSGAAR